MFDRPQPYQINVGNNQKGGYILLERVYGIPSTAGTTCLQASLNEKNDDNTLEASFVSVEWLGPADPVAAERYRPSNPDRMLKNS
jgi:hypothetical protein